MQIKKPAIEGGPKTRNEFLVFSKPYFAQEEIDEVVATLKSGWVGTGPRTTQFEKEFAQYVDVPYAVALNSCTAGLQLALHCLNLTSEDEVIVPALTFCATANAVLHTGARVRFADVHPQTQCVTAETLLQAVSPRTRAIIVVHFAGHPAPMDEILEFSKSRNITVIEDCAHAIETLFQGKHAGTFGWVGCFSFYATKNISSGEGGMLVTSDEKLAARARKLSLHGLSKDAFKRFSQAGYQHYGHDEAGFKYNMPDLLAAVGIHQLRRVSQNYALRLRLWQRYLLELKSLPLRLPAMQLEKNDRHGLHLFQIRVDAKLRDQFLRAYGAEGIGVGVHYLALPSFPLYKSFVRQNERFDHANQISAQTISLPLGTSMVEKDVDDVVVATHKLFRFYLEQKQPQQSKDLFISPVS